MMALACTYFPPTCAMTSAYSLSAPTAMIVPFAGAVPSASEDEQPAASRAAPARAAHARMARGSVARLLQRFGMAGFSQVSGMQASAIVRVGVASNDNDSHFCWQRGWRVGVAGLPARGCQRRTAGVVLGAGLGRARG